MALTLNLGYGLIAFGGVLAVASLAFTLQLPMVAMIVAVVGIAAAIAGLVNVIVGAARAF